MQHNIDKRLPTATTPSLAVVPQDIRQREICHKIE